MVKTTESVLNDHKSWTLYSKICIFPYVCLICVCMINSCQRFNCSVRDTKILGDHTDLYSDIWCMPDVKRSRRRDFIMSSWRWTNVQTSTWLPIQSYLGDYFGSEKLSSWIVRIILHCSRSFCLYHEKYTIAQ